MTHKRINLLLLALGLLALLLVIRESSPSSLLAHMRGMGWGFLWLFPIEIASNFGVIVALYYVFAPKERPPFSSVVLASFAALSLSGSLPGGQGGELVRGNLLQKQAPLGEVVAAIFITTYLNALLTALLALSALVPAFAGPFPAFALLTLLAVGAALAGALLLLLIPMRRGLMRRLLTALRRQPWRLLHASDATLAKSDLVDARLRSAFATRRTDLLRAACGLLLGRLFSVLEAWVVLASLGLPADFATLAAVFAATTFASFLLLALPVREGYTESGSYLIFAFLGLSAAGGLSFELVRRARKIAFQILGLGFLGILTRRGSGKPQTPLKTQGS